jgi:DNA repair protein SbcC/Rad50
MRPERLELEGFGVYRDATLVDFVGADLFALTGPTGAGKSTVIDAICFALYGNVPRLADERAVAPVISQGRLQASVAFDFSVDGQGYRAVRVVRATGRGGASTKEARLVRRDDDEVLAGSADELTDAVTDLLGLSWAHFTTCVVLPQGEFMRFLHEKPSKRQDLLVELLDLRLFGAMRDAARGRVAAAETRVELAERLLEDCAFATPEARGEAADRVVRLTALLAHVDDAQPRLDALHARHEALVAEVARHRADRERLAAVQVPDDVRQLAARRLAALHARDRARGAEADAIEAVDASEARLGALGDRAALEQVAADHRTSAELADRIANGVAYIDDRRAGHAAACAVLDDAASRRDEAVVAVEAARSADRAGELALALVSGEPCPVCGQVVHDLPTAEDDRSRVLREADRSREEAERAYEQARRAEEDLRVELGSAEGRLDALTAQLDDVRVRLAGAPEAGAVGAALVEIGDAETALGAARRRSAEVAAARRHADEEHDAAVAAERSARSTLMAARDALAGLDPPIPAGDDLARDWEVLASWAGSAIETATARAAEADTERARTAADHERLADEVLTACREAGFADRQPGRQVAAELQRFEDALSRIDEAAARATELAAERDLAETDQRLAAALVQHLNANRFEKWVLDEALRRLVARATVLLGELSGGAYSLTLDAKGATFAVVDHANADAVRSARTLSGGETFLASLALALALADEVVDLASGGAARLESLFLDEGFGTLDADTLDVVATALEELQAGGRMVGLVSHVPELAERMPCRYVVRKGPAGSTIERVDG